MSLLSINMIQEMQLQNKIFKWKGVCAPMTHLTRGAVCSRISSGCYCSRSQIHHNTELLPCSTKSLSENESRAFANPDAIQGQTRGLLLLYFFLVIFIWTQVFWQNANAKFSISICIYIGENGKKGGVSRCHSIKSFLSFVSFFYNKREGP